MEFEVKKLNNDSAMEKPILEWSIRFEITNASGKVVGRIFREELLELAKLVLEIDGGTVFEWDNRLYHRSAAGECTMVG